MGGVQGKALKALLSGVDRFAETSNFVQVILVGFDLVAEKFAISSRMVTVANYLAQAKRYFEKARSRRVRVVAVKWGNTQARISTAVG